MLPTNIGGPRLGPGPRIQVVGLSDHRSRRRQRLLLARAMQSGDPVRSELLEHLNELTDILGADRAAAVWLDEYAADSVHAHVTLDLLSDRPRRSFPVEPLDRAWELGLPGVFEGSADTPKRIGEGAGLFAVALGSDGVRAWFLACDSVGPRPRLGKKERQRVLFLAGACAGILLHQDLDQVGTEAQGRLGGRSFSGFPVLEDCEGREQDAAVTAKVEQRFVVVRLVRALLSQEPGYSICGDWAERVGITRAEVARRGEQGGDSREVWSPLLDELEAQRLPELAERLVLVGERAESDGHVHGALELYRCAFEAAALSMHAAAAIDALRFQGRVNRRFARWDDAVASYQRAYDIAEAAALWEKASRVLVGLASVRKELGSLPEARRVYRDALDLAYRAGEKDAIATAHHGLLSFEHAAGNTHEALRHGWTAVATYEDVTRRSRCLANLAGALADFGDRSAAEDAWTVVADTSEEAYYRIYAHDALAHLAALRGDLAAFEIQAAACDALGWESGPRSAKAEILYYRGLSYRALGFRDAADRWLTRATAFAEEFGFNRTLFRAEQALRELEELRGEELELLGSDSTTPSAPDEIRVGLREMRRAVADACV